MELMSRLDVLVSLPLAEEIVLCMDLFGKAHCQCILRSNNHWMEICKRPCKSKHRVVLHE